MFIMKGGRFIREIANVYRKTKCFIRRAWSDKTCHKECCIHTLLHEYIAHNVDNGFNIDLFNEYIAHNLDIQLSNDILLD